MRSSCCKCRGTADWLPDGLPSAPAADLLATYLQPGLAVVRLPLLRGLNWVPVPHLAPQPSRCTLLATRNTEGEGQGLSRHG